MNATFDVDSKQVDDDVQRALAEDLDQRGDVSAQLLASGDSFHVQIISREAAVICGLPWLRHVFLSLDANVEIELHVKEGQQVDADTVLCTLSGPAGILLSGERTALNFVQLLSATATQARRYVDAVKGLNVNILDTRKTLPGLRYAQKYAARVGGCVNHRMGLYDAVLLKENHISAAGGITQALQRALQQYQDIPVEIEVESLDELREALAAGGQRIMLDNFNLEAIREAVRINAGRARLEVSGDVTLDNIRAIAETGVDDISIGAITKHVKAIDLSMLARKQP